MGFFDFFTDRTPAEPAEIRLVAFVSGKVQGVGFRWRCSVRLPTPWWVFSSAG